MIKKADIWMPWYVADYLADTAHLTTEHHGAYCLMLMAAWKRGGSLPKDEGQLAAVCRLPPAKWKSARSVLLPFFVEGVDCYTHQHVTSEWEKAQATSQKKAAIGAEGAAKRWNRDGEANAHGNGRPIAAAMAQASQIDAPSPSPSPLPSDEGIQPASAGLSPAAQLTQPASTLVGDEGTNGAVPTCPHRRLIALFVEKLPELPKPRVELWLKGKNADAMRQRWRWLLTAKREDGIRYATTLEDGVQWFGAFFDRVAESDFLTGRSGGSWRCDLGWLMKQEKFTNVVEKHYQNNRRAA